MILFDEPHLRNHLKPLTLTRPIADLRLGIFTIKEKWQHFLAEDISYLTEDYLNKKFKTVYRNENLYINASVLPTQALIDEIRALPNEVALVTGEDIIALKSAKKLKFGFKTNGFSTTECISGVVMLRKLPHLFLFNAEQIQADFDRITAKRMSVPINDPYTCIYGVDNIFVEEGVNIKAAILNAENGPIYIGKNAVIQEGSLIIGPAAIGENSMVAFGAKIRPNVTLGPVCRVGGEVGNSIFMGYSNKAHDGFLGNSVIGEWCNLGANTNNSNLKNDYKEVKLYDYQHGELVSSDELFCGTFMGDFTKAGISTMFNTGTVIGVSSNIFGAGFQDKFVPSFLWGGKTEGYEAYRFEKAIEVINATMARREKQLTAEEIEILKYIQEKEA